MTEQDRHRRGPPSVADVEARAARHGITPDRVLQECARIAFSNIHRIIEWDEKGVMRARTIDDISEDDFAAIAEVVASASSRNIYRIKLHDKKPVLDTLARHLGMLPTKPGSNDEKDDGEDPVDFLIAELDRLAGEAGEGSADAGPEPDAA